MGGITGGGVPGGGSSNLLKTSSGVAKGVFGGRGGTGGASTSGTDGKGGGGTFLLKGVTTGGVSGDCNTMEEALAGRGGRVGGLVGPSSSADHNLCLPDLLAVPLPISTDGFRGGTLGGGGISFSGGISSSGVSLIGSGLPATEEEFLTRLPPFDSFSSFSEISDKEAPCLLAGELMMSNESDDIDDKEIFLPLVLDFDVLIPGDFNEMSVFRGCE